MIKEQGVFGIFSYIDSTVQAIKRLREADFKNLRVFSPFPSHEIEEALERRESIVRFFTLTGATLGALCGLTLTILTVLFGSLATLLGLLINSRLRRNAPRVMYDPRFSEDKFGIAVVCKIEDIREVKEVC